MPSFPAMPTWLSSAPRLGWREDDYQPLLQNPNASQDDVDSEMQAAMEKVSVQTRLPRRFLISIGAVLTVVVVVAVSANRVSLPLTWNKSELIDAVSTPNPSDCSWNGLPCRPIPLASHNPLSRDGGHPLNMWIEHGNIPADMIDLTPYDSIDGVWLWVNGSDPRHQLSRSYFQADGHDVLPEPSQKQLTTAEESEVLASIGKHTENFVLKNLDKRFRENDELKYSLRGAWDNVRGLRVAHIISPDYWPSGSGGGVPSPHMDSAGYKMRSDTIAVEGKRHRQGQLPQWLDESNPRVAVGQDAEDPHSKALIRFHHDWNVFQPLRSVDPKTQTLPSETLSEEELIKWKEAHLPTFNSNVAESFLGINLKGASEVFFYSNDDMFFRDSLQTGDFYTPLYGPVLHMQADYSFFGSMRPAGHGDEASSQRFAAELITKRFGLRQVHYPTHVQKTLSRPHMLESRLIWGDLIEKSNKGRFRGSTQPINTHILTNGLLIERHREALLWSFFVARMDKDGDGIYSDEEFEALQQELGRTDRSLRTRAVDIPRRDTLRSEMIAEQLNAVKFSHPLQNSYAFTSLDGFYGTYSSRHASGWPSFTPMSPKEEEHMSNGAACHFRYDSCFADNARDPKRRRSVDDVFRRFAFEGRACGDCAISYLVGKSGTRGLSAFLPSHTAAFPSSVSEHPSAPPDTPPHLSLSSTHKNATFDLAHVADHTGRKPGDLLRPFVNQLLHRYQYVIASVPSDFEMLRDAKNTKEIFEKLDRKKQAFVCLNDDIEKERDQILTLMSEWFKKSFPRKLPFERD